jgi:hypothetical protein
MTHEDQQEMATIHMERQQRIEEAIIRAENGEATQADFDIIRFECGLKSPSPSQETADALDVFFGDSILQLTKLSIGK